MAWSLRTRSETARRSKSAVQSLVLLVILASASTVRAQSDFWEPTDISLTSSILSLASSPRGYLFAGTDDRKVVRSSNGGATWTEVGDAQLSVAIPSLAVDSLGTVFAGTDFRGLFRSTDDGSTWLPSTLTEERISCLLLSPQGFALAGAWDKGIYRSSDGGATWALVGAAGHKVRSIIATPAGILIAAADTTAQEGRLYRSTDGGRSWTRTGTGFSSGVIHALASISADTMFAGTAGQGIYRSTDVGGTWSSSYLFIPSTVSALVNLPGGGVFAGVLLGGGGVVRTTDSGEHWFFETSGLVTLDVRSMILGRDGRLYAGTGEGVFRSVQALTTVARAASLNHIPTLRLEAHPNPFNSQTEIAYAIPRAGPVTLTLFDLRGRRTAIVEREWHPAGAAHVRWVADNRASGMYIILLETSEGAVATKLLLLK